MKTIAIIPARGGSKRLTNKNILSLDGIPLIAHSILYAQANDEFIEDIYVSTDNPDIKKIALQYGAKVIDRPTILSGDFEPTVSALKHVIESLYNHIIDINIILLQPTNPLRPDNLLKDAFDLYKKGKHDSLFTVTQNHQKLGKIINNKFFPFNYTIGQRSQELEHLFFENGLLYISNAKLILGDKILSEKAYPMIVNHPFANVDIDNQIDLDYANFLIKNI